MSTSGTIKQVSWLCLGASLLVLSACDRQAERTERLQTLGEAVIDQVTGQGGDESSDERLKNVSVDARAMAGEIEPLSLPPLPQASQRQYVIGSIVAKPRDMPEAWDVAKVQANPELANDIVVDRQAEAKLIVPTEAMVREAEEKPEILDAIEQPVTKTRTVTVIDPRAVVRTRDLSSTEPALPRRALKEQIAISKTRGLTTAPYEPVIVKRPLSTQERVETLPDLKPKLAQRALTMRNEALEKQIIAEDKMITAASKYGLAASIQRSRTGQMVIEIGTDAVSPTQFTVQDAGPKRLFEIDTEERCGNTRDLGRARPAQAMACVIEELQASGEFEYVEKDYLFDHEMIWPGGDGPTNTALITPNDPLFDMQWHFKNQADQAGGASFADFWTREGTQGSSEIVVAVVDTGLEMSHPDIAGSPNVVAGWDMVTDPDMGNDGDSRDSDPNDPGDMCPEKGRFTNSFHGTHVAGTVGAGVTNNATGVAGGAWNVKIVPVRALGRCGGRLSDINDAIRWAAGTIPEYDELGEEVWNDNPADIINLSIGLFKTCPASMQDAIDAVTAEGVIVVAAAGNSRVSTNFYAPGGCNNVVTVAAGDARGFIAPYSNFGDKVDLLAPGGDLSRDDNGDGNPDGVLSTKTAENCFDPVSQTPVASCNYAYEQGTSMAAPHVSAAFALMKSKRPDLGASDLISRLISAATPIEEAQCLGSCTDYPGGTPTDADSSICLRPCGQGLLNLSNVNLSN